MQETFYAVEFRNMSTAVHGLLLYEDIDVACRVDEALSELEEIDFSDYDTNALLELDKVTDDYTFSEIDYRDVDWDENQSEWIYTPSKFTRYDDDTIIVVNDDHDVHDVYGF